MRVFVRSSGADVAAQLALARAAEASGLDGVWVHGPASAHGDSYATTAAAAIASATVYPRICVELRLTAPDDVLRLAEDLAVLDHCSAGRAELCLSSAAPDDAARLLFNLHTCTADDRQVAVTPGPLQPTIPVSDARVLQVPVEQTGAVVAALIDPTALAAAVDRLRAAVRTCSARDVVFTVAAHETPAHVDALASIVAPLLRANDDEVPDMVLDTLTFRTARTAFDPAPAPLP